MWLLRLPTLRCRATSCMHLRWGNSAGDRGWGVGNMEGGRCVWVWWFWGEEFGVWLLFPFRPMTRPLFATPFAQSPHPVAVTTTALACNSDYVTYVWDVGVRERALGGLREAASILRLCRCFLNFTRRFCFVFFPRARATQNTPKPLRTRCTPRSLPLPSPLLSESSAPLPPLSHRAPCLQHPMYSAVLFRLLLPW